jgi:hypothetical protein
MVDARLQARRYTRETGEARQIRIDLAFCRRGNPEPRRGVDLMKKGLPLRYPSKHNRYSAVHGGFVEPTVYSTQQLMMPLGLNGLVSVSRMYKPTRIDLFQDRFLLISALLKRQWVTETIPLS